MTTLGQVFHVMSHAVSVHKKKHLSRAVADLEGAQQVRPPPKIWSTMLGFLNPILYQNA